MSSKQIIELTGLPAAGKSSAERTVLECLSARRQPTLGRSDLVQNYIRTKFCRAYGPRYWLRRPVTLRYRARVWMSHLRDRGSAGLGLASLRGACGLAGYLYSEDLLLYSHYLATSDGALPARSVYVASEGLVNHAAALTTWCGPAFESLCDRWMQIHPQAPLIVLHLEAPLEEAFARFWNRGMLSTWPRWARSREGARDAFERFQHAIEASLDRFARAGIRVAKVDASAPLGRTTELLREILATVP